jgi:hypothetical protein
MPMAKCRLSTPDDPMYAEGPQSYAPHWTRSLPMSNKPEQPASSQQEQKPLPKMKPWREVSPEEARRLGVPIRNDFIISPTPRAPAGKKGDQ